MTRHHSRASALQVPRIIACTLALGLIAAGSCLQWAAASNQNSPASPAAEANAAESSGSAQQVDDGAVPALFTADQAEAGKDEYRAHCANCHGSSLEGRVGPTLKGPKFAAEKNHFTVAKIFSYVAYQMPGGSPGSLEHDQYVKLMAFILNENGYPAGNQPLTFDDALHSEVPLVSRVEESDGSHPFQNIGQF
ncbi:MAG: c-type cytochrome [Pseudoxanthomonas sp.]